MKVQFTAVFIANQLMGIQQYRCFVRWMEMADQHDVMLNSINIITKQR
jgi:hypothetical protein